VLQSNVEYVLVGTGTKYHYTITMRGWDGGKIYIETKRERLPIW
jgi:hypothetical protein